MQKDNSTLTVKAQEQSIVMPAVTADEAVKRWREYQDLKKRIIETGDIQVIQGKEFLKKSYWRKIATFFNLSVEIISESKEQLGKTFVWHFACKAIAPNGRYAVGVGSCDAFEKAYKKNGDYVDKYGKPAVPNSIHNIRATAETRAFNRAISNLVGGGEVSAEEVSKEDLAKEELDMNEIDKNISQLKEEK